MLINIIRNYTYKNKLSYLNVIIAIVKFHYWRRVHKINECKQNTQARVRSMYISDMRVHTQKHEIFWIVYYLLLGQVLRKKDWKQTLSFNNLRLSGPDHLGIIWDIWFVLFRAHKIAKPNKLLKSFNKSKNGSIILYAYSLP